MLSPSLVLMAFLHLRQTLPIGRKNGRTGIESRFAA
jgi:hypothetical protein